MELGYAKAHTERYISSGSTAINADRSVEQRLAELLKLNAEIAADRRLFRSDRERLEASLMVNPLTSTQVYSYFGFLIGTFPPFVIALRLSISPDPIAGLFVILIAAAGILTGLIGNGIGKSIPKFVARVQDFSLPNRIVLLALIGFMWGAIAGAAGGVVIFVIGAFFAGILGGIVGAIALPFFAMLHQALRRGDLMEARHFFPIGLGLTLALCAFILGL